MIDLMLLGTGGMMPLPNRWLSSLLVRVDGDLILFDCGEGTQIPWRRTGWGFKRVGVIAFSHMHADHVAGLPGLLHSIANAGRTEPVLIVGPPGTAAVVDGLRTIARLLPFDAPVTELQPDAVLQLRDDLVLATTAGQHALPCLGYRLDRARQPRFLVERAMAAGVPRQLWSELQTGSSVIWDRGAADPAEFLGEPRAGVSLGFLTDTRPLSHHAEFFRGADLLVCEATYATSDDAEKAVRHQHMTFAEAATLAREADAGGLWLTHFSPALEDPAAFRDAAAAAFPAVQIGFDGMTGTIRFPESE